MQYFNAFYSLYPRKVARKDAEKAAKNIPETEWPQIMEGVKKYIIYWKQTNTEKQFIPLPATFLRGRRWEDEIETPEEKHQESALSILLSSIHNKNNLTMPEFPHDVKQAFFRIGIPWNKLQSMTDDDVIRVFEKSYSPKPVVDHKMLASGDKPEISELSVK